MSKLRIAEVITHPIQNRVPVYRVLASSPEVDFEALFLTRHGVQPSYDIGYGKTIAYDLPLLEGYSHRFIPNLSRKPGPDVGFMGSINPALVAILARERFDAVQIHGWSQASPIIALAACRATGTPYLLSGESNLADHFLSPAKRLVKQVVVGEFVRSAAAVLCIGRENRRFWSAFGARSEQLFDAPYSVDNAFIGRVADEARASGARDELRAQIGAGPEDLVVLNSSKLQEDRKRMSVLIDALAKLSRNIIAVFAGDGADRAQLEEHIRRTGVRAVILGFVNQTQIPKWYAAADVLSLASELEPWGLVANEAMAAGLPIVLSDRVGSAADLVVPEQTGYVYRYGDVDALAQALGKMMADPALVRRLGANARVHIARYAPERTAAGVIAAARVVSERRRRS